MTKRLDLTGKTFGRLKVIKEVERAKSKGGFYRVQWLCECSCGNTLIVGAGNLTKGNTKSCGCLKKEKSTIQGAVMGAKYGGQLKKEDGVVSLNSVLNSYKQSARRRNLPYLLSDETFKRVTKENCAYCGAPPNRSRQYGKTSPYIYNGLDRKDNNLGYTEENVVACCWDCNQAKGEQSVEDFLEHIKRMYFTTNKTVV